MVANEISFLSWAAFKRMAPPIMRLEIGRLSRLIETVRLDEEAHNALVRTRFELKQFVACLERADKASVEPACAAHLRAALLALSFDRTGLDVEAAGITDYILDRINYVHDRIGLIY